MTWPTSEYVYLFGLPDNMRRNLCITQEVPVLYATTVIYLIIPSTIPTHCFHQNFRHSFCSRRSSTMQHFCSLTRYSFLLGVQLAVLKVTTSQAHKTPKDECQKDQGNIEEATQSGLAFRRWAWTTYRIRWRLGQHCRFRDVVFFYLHDSLNVLRCCKGVAGLLYSTWGLVS